MLRGQASRSTFTGELLGTDALHWLYPFWNDLCTRLAEDNVYYTPRYARALLDNLPDAEIRLAVVWHEARLVAMLPVMVDAFSLTPLAPSRAWQTPYTFSCTPLLDATLIEGAAQALVGVLAKASDGEWHLPTLNVDGLACLAITGALARAKIPFDFCKDFTRASLQQGPGFADYLSQHLPARRRRDLQRNRRKLATLGRVEHVVCTDSNRLARGIEAFLQLEASGWKGTRGTALANTSETKRFAQHAFAGENARVDLLTLNDEPIAASVAVMAGRVGFTVKCAYDERYRSYSAGLLLELEVIRSFLEERWAERLDAATAGEHVIDELWNGQIRVADLVISFSARQPGFRVAALKRWYDLKRDVKDAIRSKTTNRLVARARGIGMLGVW